MINDTILKRSVMFLLFGQLFFGIAHIALLPPWEGFDETAHYSSIQQIADTKTLPRYGSARISGEVEKYAQFAPIPYSGSPPVEKNGGYTYKSFFDSSTETWERGFNHVSKSPPKPREFIEGEKINWQSQHPPVYYLTLAPIYLLTNNFSWNGQLFVLRLISYLFAWIALVIGAYTCLTELNSNSSSEPNSIYYWAILGFGIWPLIFPSWFTDMARIGNDSLCALIIALIWFVLVKSKNYPSIKSYVILGVLLSIGCLIKVFFIPVFAGVACFLFLRRWKIEGRAGIKSNLFNLLVMALIVSVISGWWYYLNWYHYGVVLGSDEMIRLKNAGGLLTNLVDNFSIGAWVRGHAAAVTTFAWSGTWSFARPPYIFLLPMAFAVIFLFSIYIYAVRQYNVTMIEWLPAWCTLPVLAGLGYHILVRIALIGEGRGTGGYYLHFLVVPLVMALGIGLKSIWIKKGFRITAIILFIYAIIFSSIIFLTQNFLFTGMMHISGDNKFYQISNNFSSLFNWPEIITRLSVLAFPYLGLTAFIFGIITVVMGFKLIWRTSINS